MQRSNHWALAVQSLKSNQPAVLVIVVDHQGSVPGKTGALMVVNPDRVEGTVGGGLVEHQLIELGRQNPEVQLFPFGHDGEGSDSICSGYQTFAILPLYQKHLEALETLSAMEAEGRTGTLTLDRDGPSIESSVIRENCFTGGDDNWSFVTPIGPLDSLTIVGGGHVALALSRVMATLPFRIAVLDDRRDLPTLENNIWAHSTQQIRWDEVEQIVPEGDHSWAVIMTRGHAHDTAALKRLLPLKLRYLGMMGSASKVRQVFNELLSEDISSADLDRVHAPIGVPIASHTPEEIAISVAAEIIKVRNTKTNETQSRQGAALGSWRLGD